MEYDFWYQNPEWVSAVGTIFVGLVAVSIAIYSANKDWFHKWLFNLKPDIKIDKKVFNYKQSSTFVSRMRFVNRGKIIARNVSVVVEKLYYMDNGEYKTANNFTPFPLRWTHYNTDILDLLTERPYYLDLCEVGFSNAWISSPFGSPGQSNLDDIKTGLNMLRIKLYSENHEKKSYKVEVAVSGKFESPNVSSITKIIEE